MHDHVQSHFAPALGRAVKKKLKQHGTLEDIEALVLSGCASLRGIRRLEGLRELFAHGLRSLDGLRGHPALCSLGVVNHRGRTRLRLDCDVLPEIPALRELLLHDVRFEHLDFLRALPLEKLAIRFCDTRDGLLSLPETLVELQLDSISGLRLNGVCPGLRLVDLWGTGMNPCDWLVRQPAIEELWLIGCEVPSLAPMLTMPRPPRWVFMDGHHGDDFEPYREAVVALEARGSRFAFGEPHGNGIWIPSMRAVSPLEMEPIYLSPGWPRASTTNSPSAECSKK